MILSELFHTTEKNVYKFLSGDYKTEIKRGLREENYKPHTHTHTHIYTQFHSFSEYWVAAVCHTLI